LKAELNYSGNHNQDCKKPDGGGMSLFDYQKSMILSTDDPPFAALIMAAIRRADTQNCRKLALVFPDIYAELQERYNSPGGELPDDDVAGCRIQMMPDI
jgi:hypothetical protein